MSGGGGSLEALLSRAQRALEAGRNKEALGDFDAALALDPGNPRALEGRERAVRAQIPGTLTLGPSPGTLTLGPDSGGSDAPGGSAAVWRQGTVVDGLYEVQGVLGEGGFGTVYKVRHLGWHMDLAVKCPRSDRVSSPRAMERFVAEANTWVGLGLHPHIVTCNFVRVRDGVPRIFIEFVEGGTLAEWIARGRLTDPKAALDAAIQLARAMERGQGRGLVHRDLKPGNCMMTPGGTLKVTDFGLAKLGPEEEAPEPGSETAMTGRLGTPEYMAPEQWYQAGTATSAADIWAFGAVLYELACGRKPFRLEEAEPVDAFHARMLSGGWSYPALVGVPGDWKSIVSLCLVPKAEKRAQLFSVLRGRLEDLYQEMFGQAYPRQSARETPILADTLINQGVSLADLGKSEEALRLFGAALKQDPAHPGGIYNQAMLLFKEKKLGLEEFLGRVEACRKARPKEWVPAYLLGLARLQGQDKSAGVRELEAAGKISRNPLIKTALDLAGSGRHEAALEFFVSLPKGTEATHMEEALFATLMARARKERDAGRPGEAYESLMKARGIKGYERSPLALDLQARLGEKGRRAGLRGGWLKLAFQDGSGGALCAAASPDGELAVSGHEDGSVKVWKLRTGTLLHVLNSNAGPVRAVGFAPDGARAVSRTEYKVVMVWDPRAGTREDDDPGAVAWLRPEFAAAEPSLRLSAVGQAVKLHAAPEGACLWTGDGHAAAVTGAWLAAGARYILSSGRDGLRLWELDWGYDFRNQPEEPRGRRPIHPALPDFGISAKVWGAVAGLLILAGTGAVYISVSDKGKTRPGAAAHPGSAPVFEARGAGASAAPAPGVSRPGSAPGAPIRDLTPDGGNSLDLFARANLDDSSLGASAGDRMASQQAYLAGITYFQEGKLAQARDAWKLAVQYNPGNAHARSRLEGLDRLPGGWRAGQPVSPSPHLDGTLPKVSPGSLDYTLPRRAYLMPRVRGKWIVDAAGTPDSDTASLAEALANAVDGDHIAVRPGTYLGSVFIKPRVTVEGSGPGPESVILKGSGPETVSISTASAILRNLTVRHDGLKFSRAILNRKGALTLDRVHIHSSPGAMGVESWGGTVSATDLKILSSYIGVEGIDGATLKLDRVEITAPGAVGVRLARWGTLELTGSTIIGSGSHAIMLFERAQARVVKTTVSESKYCALSIQAASVWLDWVHFNRNRCGVIFHGGGGLISNNGNFTGNAEGALSYEKDFRSKIAVTGSSNRPPLDLGSATGIDSDSSRLPANRRRLNFGRTDIFEGDVFRFGKKKKEQ